MKLSPARVAAFLAGLSGLAGAIAVPVANLDTHDTSAVIGGMAVIVASAASWLKGQREHEARQAGGLTPNQARSLLNVPTTSSVADAQFYIGGGPQFIADKDEPGDPDALPHLPVTDPEKIDPDKGDAGPGGQS